MPRLLTAAFVLATLGHPVFAGMDLAEKVVVRVGLAAGGFGSVTETEWSVDTDGKWEEAGVKGGRRTVKRSGVIGEKRLDALAAELKRYDILGLRTDSTMKGDTPTKLAAFRTIDVTYGEAKASLSLRTSEDLGKPDVKTNGGRFAGVVAAVKAATRKK